MAPLPTIHLLHASDAPQHLGKLKEILQKLKAENRIADFTTWDTHADPASLKDQTGDDDLALTLLTHELEPRKEEIESMLREVKTQTPGLKIAEIIVDHVPYENEFITFPSDLKPIRSRKDMDAVWNDIEQNLKQMFPMQGVEPASEPVDWSKYLKVAGIVLALVLAFFLIRELVTNNGVSDGHGDVADTAVVVPVPNANDEETPATSPDEAKVTELSVSVSESSFTGACPHQFSFTGKITVKQPATVKYTWLRSDGATAPVQTLNFEEAGTQTINTSWTLGGAGNTYNNMWQQVKIIEPSEMVSDKATFTLKCQEEAEPTGQIQVSPADGSVFSHFPRTTNLEWNPVPGAESYTVEIDCYHCCENNQWCADVGQVWKKETGITDTKYTFSFAGAQPGRWRVRAVDADGRVISETGWWEFRYTR